MFTVRTVIVVALSFFVVVPAADADGESESRRIHGFLEHTLQVGGALSGPRTFDNARVLGMRGRAVYDAGVTLQLGAERAWATGLGIQVIFAGEGTRVAVAPRVHHRLNGPWSLHALAGVTIVQEGDIKNTGVRGPTVLAGVGLHRRWIAFELTAQVARYDEVVPDVADPTLVLPAGTEVAMYAGVSLSDPPVWIALGIEAAAALAFVLTYPGS